MRTHTHIVVICRYTLCSTHSPNIPSDCCAEGDDVSSKTQPMSFTSGHRTKETKKKVKGRREEDSRYKAYELTSSKLHSSSSMFNSLTSVHPWEITSMLRAPEQTNTTFAQCRRRHLVWTCVLCRTQLELKHSTSISQTKHGGFYCPLTPNNRETWICRPRMTKEHLPNLATPSISRNPQRVSIDRSSMAEGLFLTERFRHRVITGTVIWFYNVIHGKGSAAPNKSFWLFVCLGSPSTHPRGPPLPSLGLGLVQVA